MTAPYELSLWLERYQRGIFYWKNQVPGLALIHDLLSNPTPQHPLPSEFSERKTEFDAKLGLGLLAIAPNDWRLSHLSIGVDLKLVGEGVALLEGPDDPSARMFGLIGKSIEKFQPQETLEKKLEQVLSAYTVVGQRGSGKGTVLEFMEEKGITTAPSSRGLREVAKVLLQRDASTPELVEMGKQFKEMFGFDVFIKMILTQMTALPSELWRNIGIDGLRTQQEIDIFRQLFGNRAKVIGLTRSGMQNDQEGWAVVKARQMATGKIEYASFEDYVKTQLQERERIERLIRQSDVIIINDETEEALRAKVHALLLQ